MDKLETSKLLKFIDYIVRLKHTPRRGWLIRDIPDHERVAGHMYSMAMMTFLIGDELKLDRLKCMQLALVHDLAESIVGDIVPADRVPTDVKHQMEDDAMKKITTQLGDELGTTVYNLYKEYEAKETDEAKFVKDLDRFDLLYTAVYYEKRDQTPGRCQEFFDSTQNELQHPFIKRLMTGLEELRRQQNGECN